jgi:MFS family permease
LISRSIKSTIWALLERGCPVGKLYRDRNLQLMFGVTFMVVLGVSSTMPALPAMMKAFAIPARSIGLIMTVFTLPGVFLAPIAGVLADRIGRKKLLVASLMVFGVFGTACAFAPDFETLLVLRTLQGVGVASIGILNLTIISDLYDGAERITALAYLTMVFSVATAAFPALGGFLTLLGWNYPFLLSIAAIPLGILIHRELDNPELKKTHSFKEYVESTFSVLFTKQAAGIFLITLLTLVILYGPVITYLPVLLNDKFGVSSAWIGLIISISALFTGLISTQVGRLTHRFREKGLLMAAFVLFLISLSLIPLLSSLWALIIPVALFGTAMGLNAPSRISLLAQLSSMDQRASVMAAHGMIQRLGQTIAPIVMGAVLAGLGIDAVFWAGSILVLIMMGVAYWTLR